jgi:hypothetical protein
MPASAAFDRTLSGSETGAAGTPIEKPIQQS